MSRNAFAFKPSILAPTAGALLSFVFSLTRVAGQPFVSQVPVIAAISTLLVFLIPGAATGVIAPRSWFWNGAILGMAAAVFVTLQANGFSQLDWSSHLLHKTTAVFACFIIPLCIVGALGGRIVSRRL